LDKAGFGELVRGAALAAQNAGITSPNVHEYYRELFLAKYTIQGTSEQTSGTTSAHAESAHREDAPTD